MIKFPKLLLYNCQGEFCQFFFWLPLYVSFAQNNFRKSMKIYLAHRFGFNLDCSHRYCKLSSMIAGNCIKDFSTIFCLIFYSFGVIDRIWFFTQPDSLLNPFLHALYDFFFQFVLLNFFARMHPKRAKS